MSRRVDLHTHTTASDGTDTPTQLIENAVKVDIATVAVTDHDTLSGLAEAKEAAARCGIGFVRGIEISTRKGEDSLHILGLWVPEDAQSIEDELADMRQKRDERNSKVIALLNGFGIDISLQEVQVHARGECIGRPHIAKVLMEKGAVTSMADAFQRYLGTSGRAYVPKQSMRPEKAVELLAEIGCTVVLAHPLLPPQHADGWLDDLVGSLVEHGLAGIEAHHSSHSKEQAAECCRVARKYGLVVTGGSDYHGDNKPNLFLGKGYGSLFFSEESFNDVVEARVKRNLPV